MEQRNLLVVTVLQLVQRLTNRIDIAAAQHFTNQLHLAAATLFLDTLGEFNGVAQVAIQRDFIQRVFPSSTISAPRRFSSSASRLISLLLTQIISSSSSSTSSPGVVEPVFGLLCHLRLLKKEANVTS
jgi:uncharacterized protein (DUF2267 family)